MCLLDCSLGFLLLVHGISVGFLLENIPHSIRETVGSLFRDFALNRDSNVVSDAIAA